MRDVRTIPRRVPQTLLRVGLLNLIRVMAAHSRSKPIRENQLDKARNPAGIKSLIADFVLSILLPITLVGEPASSWLRTFLVGIGTSAAPAHKHGAPALVRSGVKEDVLPEFLCGGRLGVDGHGLVDRFEGSGMVSESGLCSGE